MSTIRLYLKANEKIFINGVVVQVDRKVAIDLLNDATFLLENHVLQREQADTPLKQLYFVIQLMMMHPEDCEQSLDLFKGMVANLLETLETRELIAGVKAADVEVQTGKVFNALKTIRNLFPVEQAILDNGRQSTIESDNSVPVQADETPMQLSQV